MSFRTIIFWHHMRHRTGRTGEVKGCWERVDFAERMEGFATVLQRDLADWQKPQDSRPPPPPPSLIVLATQI